LGTIAPPGEGKPRIVVLPVAANATEPSAFDTVSQRVQQVGVRAPRRADEAGAKQQVLRRVAGDDELGKEDEIGVSVACPAEPVDD